MENLVNEFYKEKEALEDMRKHFALLKIELIENRGEIFIKMSIRADRYSVVNPETIKDMLLRIETELRKCDLCGLIKKTVEGNIKRLQGYIKDDFGIEEGDK